jgi:hypothetical protein
LFLSSPTDNCSRCLRSAMAEKKSLMLSTFMRHTPRLRSWVSSESSFTMTALFRVRTIATPKVCKVVKFPMSAGT